MTSLRQPPAPGGNWRAWADQVVRYLNDAERRNSGVTPKTVQLMHRQNRTDGFRGAVEKASEDGVLLYDPTAAAPVVSIAGSYLPLATQTYVTGELSSYATTAYVDSEVANLATTSYVDNAVSGFAIKEISG